MKINVFDNNVRLAPMSSWEHINAFIKVNYHFIRLFYGHREAIEPDLSYFAVDFISMCTLSHMSFQYRPARSLLLLSFHIRVPSCVYVHGLNCFPFFFSYANYRDYINQMEVSKITLLWAYHNNISAAHTAKNTRTTSKEKRPIWNIKTTHGNIKFVRWVFRMWECRSYYRQAHFWIFSVWLLLLLLVWRCWSSLSTITSIKWYDKTIPTEVPEERKLRMY